jgi:hypothetical protein
MAPLRSSYPSVELGAAARRKRYAATRRAKRAAAKAAKAADADVPAAIEGKADVEEAGSERALL